MKDQTTRNLLAVFATIGRRADKAYAQVNAVDTRNVAEITRMLDAIAADVAYAKAQLLAEAKGEGA